ncbi:MAG: AraC family transcriptional regulator [Candidatus Eremiobacteraeota bacterium]|nr:AraC family transcriptional regulator [Candidatus Eremiobacteraeota bacterium]
MISVVRHAAACELPIHAHERAYFCLLIEGRYSETYAGHTTVYEPFSIALHPAQYSHSDSIASVGASFFTIELGASWHQRLRDFVDLHNVRVKLAADNVSWAAVRILHEILQTDDPNEFFIESSLYEMLSAFASVSDQSGGSAWLQAAKDYIAAHLSTNQSMAEVAAAAGVHPVSLARSFRLHEGQTAGEYVNRLRVAFACQSLSDPGARLAEIATDLGYVDQSHFTRVFKNVTGLTPGIFRSVVLQSRPTI